MTRLHCDLKKRLWSPITERSIVYKSVQRWVEHGRGEIYKQVLSALLEAALASTERVLFGSGHMRIWPGRVYRHRVGADAEH